MRRRALLNAPLGAVLGGTTLLLSEDTNFGSPITPVPAGLMATVPQLLELSQVPGLGIGVVQGGRLMWSHYAGLANASTKQPIRAASAFPAASLGKPVFALAIMRMVEAGELDLDRPLCEYLKDGTLSGALANKITARHVLSHSSGLVNWRSGHDEPLVPQFEPGTRFQYSGEGFYQLQRTAEKITGIGLEQFMHDRVFQPLGMTSSSYLWADEVAENLVAGHRGAVPFYNRDFALQLWQLIKDSPKPLKAWNSDLIVQEMYKKGGRRPEPNETVPNVAFSLLTTVADYCAFLGSALKPNGISATTMSEFRKPYSRINSALSWSLGWGLQQQHGRTMLWQWGDNGGWKNFVLADPATTSAVVVFTNGNNGMHLAERLVNAASHQDNAAFLWV